MEPVITTIAAAVALGAAAGLKDTASKAITDAYTGLRKLIQDRYQHDKGVAFAVEHVNEKPEEKNRQQMLELSLKSANADRDTELIQAAEAVLAAVEEHSSETVAGIGMDIGTLKAARLKVSSVLAAADGGTGVKIGKAKIEGTASFSHIGAASPKQ